MKRLILAFIVAAFWAPLLSTLTSESYFRVQAFILVALFTVPLTLFVAVPLYCVVRKKIALRLCTLFGIGIGSIGALLFLLMTNLEAFLKFAPLHILTGLISSLLFWLVGIWRNQNLTIDSKSTPYCARQ
jgi:hypothetical protein